MNSCLMWAADLRTPVSLNAIFDEADLKDTGIEYESHVTILYAADSFIEYDNVKLLELVHPMSKFIEEIKDKENYYVPVNWLFELSSFSNDSDYIILKLKKDNKYYELAKETHNALKKEFNVNSKFPTYTPHLTLAELEPGTSQKYIKNEILKKVLENSLIHFEDLVLSYGESGNQGGHGSRNLTNFNSVDRFFRIRELRQDQY